MLVIKELFATADRDGNYLDISDNKSDCEKWLKEGNDKQAINIIKGFVVFDSEKNIVPDNASDFHYDYDEAFDELEFFTND